MLVLSFHPTCAFSNYTLSKNVFSRNCLIRLTRIALGVEEPDVDDDLFGLDLHFSALYRFDNWCEPCRLRI